MSPRRPSRVARLTALAALVAAAAWASACSQEDLAGPARLVGDPLLDITFTPVPDAAYPGDSIFLNATHDTLTVKLTNLPPLPAGAQYAFFLADSATVDATSNDLVPRPARVIRSTRTRRPVTRDSTAVTTVVDSVDGAFTLTGTDTNTTYRVRITGPVVSQFSHFVLAVVQSGQSAPARLDRNTRFGFLWARYRDARGTATTTDDVFIGPNGAPLTLGTFAVNTARRVPFTAEGVVSGSFYGPQLRVSLRKLRRPPQGFRYAGWLLNQRTNVAVRVGPLLSPFPVDTALDSAAVASSPLFTDLSVLDARMRTDTVQLGGMRFEDFTRFLIVLEPIGTAPPTRPGGLIVFNADIPQSVSSRAPAPGTLAGKVTSTSGRPVEGTTVFLTGRTDPTPVRATAADAGGNFKFLFLAVGRYRIYAIPKGETSPRDSADVEITAQTTTTGAVGDSVFKELHIP